MSGPTIIRLIDSRIDRIGGDLIGTVVMPAYRWFDEGLSEWLWVLDADIVLDENRPDVLNSVRAIPIADPSHEVHKAGIGSKVRIRKSVSGMKYEAISLVNVVSGQVAVTTVIFTDVGVTINATVTFGSTYRKLTYDEIGDPTVNGGFSYGSIAYDSYGKFDSGGHILFLISPKVV